MTTPLTIQAKIHFGRVRKGQKVLELGQTVSPATPPGRVPRVARLLALAHRFERLIHDGEVRDYADLARLGHVTRARLSQVMNLLNLAPDIQEAILFLPPVTQGSDPLYERQLRPIMAVLDWKKQRRMWARGGRFRAPVGWGGQNLTPPRYRRT
jgi:hypothetical protein